MENESAQLGWMISGFEAILALVVWLTAVLLYGFWRSAAKPEPDAVRPSGPTGL